MARPRRLTVLLVAVTLLATALVAGCGGSDERSTSSTTPSAGVARIQGTWGGELRQSGIAPFRVRVTIASTTDPNANPVHYSGINCGGHWTFLGKTGQSYSFREVIDSGAGGKCKGVGQVTITPTGNRLGYAFRGGGVESVGALQPIAEASAN